MEDNKEYISEDENISEVENITVQPQKRKALRIIAILLLFFYACLFGLFIYMLITGSRYIFAMIFILIMYPVLLYVMVWLRKVFSK